MKKTYKYPIDNFFIGELYLYTNFGNLLSGSNAIDGKKRIAIFSQSGAINFQRDLINKYIDWENRREYTGFLTIFYRQGNKYICLHDGKTYELNAPDIIDNLVPIRDILPKMDSKPFSRISMYEALELFDILFSESERKGELYFNVNKVIEDFYVGDLLLQESTPIETTDSRRRYIDLPHHIMLENDRLGIYSFGNEDYNHTVYRCLFLRDGVDLYNLNNHQFYNPYEDSFNNIVSFKEYMTEFDIKTPAKKLTIPKALKLFKRTI